MTTSSSERLDKIYSKLLDYRERLLENPKSLSLEECLDWLLKDHEYFIITKLHLTSYLEHLQEIGVLKTIMDEETNTLDLDNFFTTNDALLMQRNVLLKIIKKHKLQNEYINETNKILMQYNLAIDNEDQTSPRNNTTFSA